jgi:hypothetical protein
VGARAAGAGSAKSVGGLAWEAVGLDGEALGERVTRYSLLATRWLLLGAWFTGLLGCVKIAAACQ